MRSVTVEIAGESIDLPVTYAAGSTLSKAGFDPFKLATTKFESMTGDDAIRILHIGAKASGSKLKHEQIGEAAYTDGISQYVTAAAKYLVAFVVAETEFPVSGEGEAEAE